MSVARVVGNDRQLVLSQDCLVRIDGPFRHRRLDRADLLSRERQSMPSTDTEHVSTEHVSTRVGNNCCISFDTKSKVAGWSLQQPTGTTLVRQTLKRELDG